LKLGRLFNISQFLQSEKSATEHGGQKEQTDNGAPTNGADTNNNKENSKEMNRLPISIK
jgi:hypothetical protein